MYSSGSTKLCVLAPQFRHRGSVCFGGTVLGPRIGGDIPFGGTAFLDALLTPRAPVNEPAALPLQRTLAFAAEIAVGMVTVPRFGPCVLSHNVLVTAFALYMFGRCWCSIATLPAIQHRIERVLHHTSPAHAHEAAAAITFRDLAHSLLALQLFIIWAPGTYKQVHSVHNTVTFRGGNTHHILPALRAVVARAVDDGSISLVATLLILGHGLFTLRNVQDDG